MRIMPKTSKDSWTLLEQPSQGLWATLMILATDPGDRSKWFIGVSLKERTDHLGSGSSLTNTIVYVSPCPIKVAHLTKIFAGFRASEHWIISASMCFRRLTICTFWSLVSNVPVDLSNREYFAGLISIMCKVCCCNVAITKLHGLIGMGRI